MDKRTLLISTLGTWSLVPEIIGFTNYQNFDLYRNSLSKGNFVQLVKQNNITPVKDLWLISSDSEILNKAKDKIESWIYSMHLGVNSKYFVLNGISDLETQEDCLFFKDLIYQVVYFAVTGGEFAKVYLSLAGGRKTMSSYLQSAGMLFGYDVMFHVLQKRGTESDVRLLENFDFRINETLGLKTVFELGEYQLNGKVEFENKNGISCTIRFRNKNAYAFL